MNDIIGEPFVAMNGQEVGGVSEFAGYVPAGYRVLGTYAVPNNPNAYSSIPNTLRRMYVCERSGDVALIEITKERDTALNRLADETARLERASVALATSEKAVATMQLAHAQAMAGLASAEAIVNEAKRARTFLGEDTWQRAAAR